MIREAGGLVTDSSGQPSQRMLLGVEVVASNGLIHEQMLTVLREVRTN
jgi:fructose-1,6-bisphosphatase/inositol monophosphatase family enzyme